MAEPRRGSIIYDRPTAKNRARQSIQCNDGPSGRPLLGSDRPRELIHAAGAAQPGAPPSARSRGPGVVLPSGRADLRQASKTACGGRVLRGAICLSRRQHLLPDAVRQGHLRQLSLLPETFRTGRAAPRPSRSGFSESRTRSGFDDRGGRSRGRCAHPCRCIKPSRTDTPRLDAQPASLRGRPLAHMRVPLSAPRCALTESAPAAEPAFTNFQQPLICIESD